MGCIKLSILDEQYKKVSSHKELTFNFCTKNERRDILVHFIDSKTGQGKRKSTVTKNGMMRSMVQQAVENQHLKFSYVLTDSLFASSDNMLFINKLKKYFVMDMKNNRLCMFSTEDRNKGQWTSLDKWKNITNR